MEILAFGPGARLHHVGLVVRSIRKICPDCRIFHDPGQKVNVAFLDLSGQRMELVEPEGEDSPVYQSLTRGTKLVHLCYEVPDLEAAIREGARHRFHCFAEPVPAVAFGGRRIAWLFSRDYGVVELLAASGEGSR